MEKIKKYTILNDLYSNNEKVFSNLLNEKKICFMSNFKDFFQISTFHNFPNGLNLKTF